MWVIYEKPAEHPDKWVVREWLVDASGVNVASWHTCDGLEHARSYITFVDPAVVRHPRKPEDDPVITEVWF